MKHNIELHIEELILHGFSPSDRYRIGEAVEKELVHILKDQGIPSSILTYNSNFDRLDGGKFEVQSNAKSEIVGIQIAQAVYRGLGK